MITKYPDIERYLNTPNDVCYNCGRTGLHWKIIDGEWFRVSEDNTIHVCPNKPQRNYNERI